MTTQADRQSAWHPSPEGATPEPAVTNASVDSEESTAARRCSRKCNQPRHNRAPPEAAAEPGEELARTPMAVLVHTRWENEAANGGGAAATTIALGARQVRSWFWRPAERRKRSGDSRKGRAAVQEHHTAAQDHHYRDLLVMGVLSFISMYILMYEMVDRFGNVYSSVNQVYMAGLMTAPMIVIELLIMRGMYHNRRLNALIAGVSVIAGVAFFVFIRQQTGVADQQFIRSMIPHHSGAILMCEEARLRDPQLQGLCQNIITSQQQEIDQMTALLRD